MSYELVQGEALKWLYIHVNNIHFKQNLYIIPWYQSSIFLILPPSKTNWIKVQEAAMVLEEQPGKVNFIISQPI